MFSKNTSPYPLPDQRRSGELSPFLRLPRNVGYMTLSRVMFSLRLILPDDGCASEFTMIRRANIPIGSREID
jgi:hypothetical protein